MRLENIQCPKCGNENANLFEFVGSGRAATWKCSCCQALLYEETHVAKTYRHGIPSKSSDGETHSDYVEKSGCKTKNSQRPVYEFFGSVARETKDAIKEIGAVRVCVGASILLLAAILTVISVLFDWPRVLIWAVGIGGGIVVSGICIGAISRLNKRDGRMRFYKTGTFILGTAALLNLSAFLLFGNGYNIIGGCFSVFQLILGIVLVNRTVDEGKSIYSRIQIGELILVVLTFNIFSFNWLELSWGILQWMIGIVGGITVYAIFISVVILLNDSGTVEFCISGTLALSLCGLINLLFFVLFKDSFSVIGGCFASLGLIAGIVLFALSFMDNEKEMAFGQMFVLAVFLVIMAGSFNGIWASMTWMGWQWLIGACGGILLLAVISITLEFFEYTKLPAIITLGALGVVNLILVLSFAEKYMIIFSIFSCLELLGGRYLLMDVYGDEEKIVGGEMVFIGISFIAVLTVSFIRLLT